MIERFADEERGGFFTTSNDHEELIARRKDVGDHPIPSGNSSAAYGLLRLAALTGESGYEDRAVGTMRLFAPAAMQHPDAFGHLLQAIDFHLSPVREVALVAPANGSGDGAALGELAGVVRSAHRPHVVLAGGPEGSERPELLARTPRRRGPARRLRLRALRLPRAGDRAERARLRPERLASTPPCTVRRQMSANEQIAVERFGSGQAILLLHGGSGPELTWERLMELAERWSLIIPTRRDADAEDVARLLTKRTHLVGFSYGALGVTLAAEEDPKMVRSLTLVETPADFVREHAGDLDALATAGIPIMLISSGREREIEVVSDEIAKQLRARREVLSDEEGDEDILTRVHGFNDVLEDFLRGSAGTARSRTA